MKMLEPGDMDKVIVRHENNGSEHYDGKEFVESISKLHRENTTGSLQIGESVMIKTKLRLWKAVIVNLATYHYHCLYI